MLLFTLYNSNNTFMLSSELFQNMEILRIDDLKLLCRKYQIHYKTKTYGASGNIQTSKTDYCKYDLIKLLQSHFLDRDKEISIVYHDFSNRIIASNEEDHIITFQNVKKLYNTIKRLYRKQYDIKFEYDKASYNILSNRWSSGIPITIKEFIVEHFTAGKIRKNITDIDIKKYEDIKRHIIASLNEYMIIKYK